MEWPQFDAETFEYYTVNTQKMIWKRAAQAGLADYGYSDYSDNDDEAHDAKVNAFLQNLANATDDWDVQYRHLVLEFTALMASSTNEQALDMAQAGLDACHDQLLFRLPNDPMTIVPAKDVFVLTSSFGKLETASVTGSKAPDIDFQLGISNPTNHDDVWYGHDACAQVTAWQDYGLLETSAAVLAKTSLMNGNLPGQLSKKKFVLLGLSLIHI